MIGAGLIVKNEQLDLPACLESISDAVDVICIVDTGSTDNTLGVIEEFSVKKEWKLIKGAWPDKVECKTIYWKQFLEASEKDDKGNWALWDFSKARNVYADYLDKVVDWVLWMDADDVLEQPDKIRGFANQIFDVVGFRVYSTGSKLVHHRLWRAGKGVRYNGPVHEYPRFMPGSKMFISDISIKHKWSAPPGQETGTNRNLRILERAYNNGDREQRTLFYYGNTLVEAKRVPEAIKVYQEYLKRPCPYHDEMVFVRLYLTRCYRGMRDFKNGFREGFEALSYDQRFSEIWMELAYMFEACKWYKRATGMAYGAYQPLPESGLFVETNKYKEEPDKLVDRCKPYC